MITNRIAVVGLDVGNCYTHVGLARGGKVDVLQNEQGKRKTPSIVGYTNDCRTYGSTAASEMTSNYKNTITQFMTFLGMTTDDPEYKDIEQRMFFQIGAAADWLKCGQQERVSCKVTKGNPKGEILPESVLAYLLSRVKETVQENTKGQSVEDCVMAVPGYWSDRERRALMGALEIGGWKPLRLMNENCALALYYGLLRPLPPQVIKVLFIDVGATHTSVSLVEFKDGNLRIVATDHDRTLGGNAFDAKLFSHLAAEIKAKNKKMDVSTNPKAQMKLLKECTRVKHILSANKDSKYTVEYLMNDTDVRGVVDRKVFEGLCTPLLDRLASPIQRVMQVAKVEGKDLHSVEIVGGTTRIPMVKSTIQSVVGVPLKTTCDSDEGVVRGATLECATLSSSFKMGKTFKAVDICVHPVNLCWDNDDGEEKSLLVFKPGDKLPVLKSIPFKKDGPFSLKLKYARDVINSPDYQGNFLSPTVPDEIGSFTITGKFQEYLKEYPQEKKPTVKVYVYLDKNGLALVREAEICLRYIKPVEEKKGDDTKADDQKEAKKGKKKIKTKPLEVQSVFVNGFTTEQIARLKAHHDQMTEADRLQVLRDEANNALETFLLSTKSDISDGKYNAYASEADRESYRSALNECEDWLYDDGWDVDADGLNKKLNDIKALGAGMFSLYKTYKEREESLADFENNLTAYASVQDIKHLTSDEKKTVADQVTEATAWIEQTRATLKSATQAMPTVSQADIVAFVKATKDKINPIKDKPVPTSAEAASEKEEEKKEEEKKEEEETPQEEVLQLM